MRLDQQELKRRRRPKPDFTGTRFHHFNDVATIAVRQYRDNPDEVAVGIAMLALPRYYTRTGVPIDLLAAGAILNPVSIAEPGDQFNRTLGRLISHGRAVKLRGLANVWSLTYVHRAILDLRRTEKAMTKPWQDNVGLLRLQYRSWTISRAILQHEIRSVFGHVSNHGR